MAEPRKYYIRHGDLEKPESPIQATYVMVHYYEWADAQGKADALDTEVQAMWKENKELRDKIQTITPSLRLRVVTWVFSFVVAFALAMLLQKLLTK